MADDGRPPPSTEELLKLRSRLHGPGDWVLQRYGGTNGVIAPEKTTPLPCGRQVAYSMLFGGGLGLVAGAMALAWYPDPYEYEHKNRVTARAMGLRYTWEGVSQPMLVASVACGVYTTVDCLLEKFRQGRDPEVPHSAVQSAAAGAVTGWVMGSLTRRFDMMAATALCTALLMGGLDWADQYKEPALYGPARSRSSSRQKKMMTEEPDIQKWLEENAARVPREDDHDSLSLVSNESKAVQELKKKYPEYRDL